MADTTRPATEAISGPDLSGRQLGGYRILRRLGRGAMAEVYLAEQLSLGRQVAVKVLRSSLATDATYVERFQHEARAAARLVHANIVQIYEVGCADQVHFIAQEYVQGLNLAELLVRRGPPDTRQVLSVARQVAGALQKAAEHGIVHRDIKPENIMLSPNGEVKVADFGLARLYTGDSANNLTQVGITMGTPLYMSPEQVEGKPLDTRSDIYALGITCYQMLAGEPPFRGETALSVAVQHLRVTPPRLENIRTDLPPSIGRIVHKMLAKDPQDRYPSPRELLIDLRAVSLELYPADAEREHETALDDDLLSTVEARRHSTERLAAAMRTTAMPSVRRRWSPAWLLAVLGCFVGGSAIAWALAERPLITPNDEVDAVARHDTAEAQYVYALMLGTEAAWKSVPEYFPQDKTWSRRSMQSLARLYLQEYDYPRAMAIFTDFAHSNDAEVQLRAFGLAGQAVVLNRQGKFAESAEKLAELWPLRDKLESEMRQLVLYTLRGNRQSLGDPQSLRRWSDWFRDSPSAGPIRPDRPAGRPSQSS